MFQQSGDTQSGDLRASTVVMGTILSTGVLQSILAGAVQSTGLINQARTANTGSGSVSALTQGPDNSQISPFAQVVSTLQELQQSNPVQYRQVTQQIASNLGSAAQTAQSAGKSSVASQLSSLAKDFSNASQSGQLPGFQDLVQGIFGRQHSGSSTNQGLNQLLSSFQTGASGSGSLNPTAIILNTLAGAGIGNTSS